MSKPAPKKRSEPKLPESFDFRQAVEESLGYICMHDLAGRLIWVNRAAAEALGFEPDEMIGHRLHDFMPRGSEHVEVRYMENLRQGIAEGTLQVPTRFGEIRFWRFRNRLIQPEKGEPYVIGHAVDITETQRAQQRSGDAEKRFRELIDAAPVMIWISGPDAMCTYYNRQWLQFTGRALDQEVGSGWEEGVHPEDLDYVRTIYLKNYLTREEYRYEYRRRRYDGEYRWILGNATPRFSANGEFQGYIGTCLDITDHKRLEHALRDNESRLRTLFDSAAVGIFQSDSQGRCTGVNRRWQEMTGLTIEEALGAGWIESLHPDDAESVLREWQVATTAGKEFRMEFRQRARDGRTNWVVCVAAPVRDEHGHVNAYLGTLTDITQRKLDEEALARTTAALRQQAELLDLTEDTIMTVDLENRITFWNQAAERTYGWTAKEALGQFAHDLLKTQLPVVRGAIEDAIWAEGRWIGEVIQQKRNGERIIVQSQEVRQYDAGRAVGSLVINTNVTKRRAAELRLKAQYKAGLVLSLSFSVEDGLRELLAVLCETMDWNAGMVYLPDDQDSVLRRLHIWHDRRFSESDLGSTIMRPDVRVGEGVIGECLRSGRERWVILGNREPDSPREQQEVDLGLRTQFVVPLLLADRVFAIFVFYSSQTLAADRSLMATLGAVFHQVQQFILRKRSEEALKAAHGLLSETTTLQNAVLNAANYAIISTDREGTNRTYNATAERWLGHGAGEVLGKADLTLFHDAAEVRARSAELSRRFGKDIGGGLEVFVAEARRSAVDRHEWTYVAKDGTRFPVVLSVTCLRGPHNEITGYLGVAEDLRERRKGEETQKRLTQILETTTDLVAIADAQGRLVHMNRAGRDMLGIDSMQDLTTQTLSGFRTPGSMLRFKESAIPAAMQSGVWSGESTLLGADGREIPVSEVLLAHRSPEGTLQHFSVIARDITAKHELERMKNEFISTVSHELRTPLTSIRGALGMLASGVVGNMPDTGQRMLDIAVTNTDRLVRLINDILDIERMESGRVSMSRRDCNAGELMTSAVEVMRPMAERAQVVVDVLPADISLIADPDRMMQTFTNLLSNAIKFSGPGGRVLFTAMQGLGTVVFQVRDEGRGIPTEKIESIFGRFQQVDASDAREKGGTGLGLAICRSIAEQHGGRVWAESEMGKGSTFFVELPLVPPPFTSSDTPRAERRVV